MSPSLKSPPGADELPSSISICRPERLKQVAGQPAMLPLLDVLDSLDLVLQKTNEEPYNVAESERLRLKATSAVRCKWPGREGDRGPLEETALQSVALLKAQLTQQVEEHPWLREALSCEELLGMALSCDELLHMVHGIAGQGPFKREDESLREAIRTYVGETLEQIYKDEEEAAAFFKGQQDKEERFSSRIREVSEQLSSEQFLHNRAGAEEFRTEVSIQLLSHFLAKAKVAAKRSGRIEELLRRKLAELDAWHAEEEQSYRAAESAELAEEGKLKDQLAQLQEFRQEQIQVHAAGLEKLQEEENLDAAELRLIKQKLQAMLKSVGSIAARHQKRCLQRSEKERLFRYLHKALQDQEVMLRSQLDLARLLVKRWQRGKELHDQFVGLIHKAYDGMLVMTTQKTEELRGDLRIESTKFAALTRATESDLGQQRSKMLAALQKTFATAKKQEEELELLERSFRPESQTQLAQSAFEESQDCVRRQEEQVEHLDRLRETVTRKSEEYEETLSTFLRSEDMVGAHTWDDQAESWLHEFFYTAHRSRLQVPQALCCEALVLDHWVDSSGGSDQSLRHAASDPTIGANFSGTGHSGLLSIRDACPTAWSADSIGSQASEEALGKIEDIDP